MKNTPPALEWAHEMPEGHRNEFPESPGRDEINGESLRCMRIYLGLSQIDLAACLGVGRRYVSQMERGAVGVSQRVRDCVAFLGAAVQWEAERVVMRGGMTVKHEGFYGVPYEDGVVWVPAKWVAQVVGRVSMGHQRSFALGG